MLLLPSLRFSAALLLAAMVALAPTVASAERPLLLANYYCWYHDGQHPKQPFLHWTYPSSETNALAKRSQKPGEPPPNSVFRPLAGLYDSADPKVAEWHVQLAKSAGIDAFLVDWWDTHNQLDQNVDRGIVAAAQKHGFKFALLDERVELRKQVGHAMITCPVATTRHRQAGRRSRFRPACSS
jgi:hypothetical protein